MSSDYEVIPTHGCEFGCRYCNVYSLKSEKTFTPVTVFVNYPDLLRQTIAEHRQMHGRTVVYCFSPKTDGFQGPLVQNRPQWNRALLLGYELLQ
ncbi:MAG: hypothetical protein QM784_37040 [Polyangiaceae bacterium]